MGKKNSIAAFIVVVAVLIIACLLLLFYGCSSIELDELGFRSSNGTGSGINPNILDRHGTGSSIQELVLELPIEIDDACMAPYWDDLDALYRDCLAGELDDLDACYDDCDTVYPDETLLESSGKINIDYSYFNILPSVHAIGDLGTVTDILKNKNRWTER